jgi:hypothetical protein
MFNARHWVRRLLAAAVTFDAQAGTGAQALDPNELLERSDMARGGGLQGVRMAGSATEIRDGRRLHRPAAAIDSDIATTNYSHDYNAALVGEGIVDGRPVWVLDLTAKTGGPAHGRIRYFVDKEHALGIKAEYFAASGNVLKTARIEYDNHVRHNGRTVRFASRVEIAEALDPAKRTILKYRDVSVHGMAPSEFGLAA